MNLKKCSKVFLLTVVLLAILDFDILAIENRIINIKVDGEVLEIPHYKQQAIITDGQVFVPIRDVMEKMGLTVGWGIFGPVDGGWGQVADAVVLYDNNVTQGVGRNDVRIMFGQYAMDINLERFYVDIDTKIVNERAMIPISNIPLIPFHRRDSFMSAYWDEVNHVVHIYSNYEPTPFHTWPINSSNWPEHLPEHVPGSIELRREGNFTGLIDLTNPLEFRFAFYSIDGRFLALVRRYNGDDAVSEFFSNVGEESYTYMTLMRFIQHFEISREDFEYEITLMREIRTEEQLVDELFEIPSADIIFTFDNDIARYFFRRE